MIKLYVYILSKEKKRRFVPLVATAVALDHALFKTLNHCCYETNKLTGCSRALLAIRSMAKILA